jgi:hypothetical protein
MTGALARRPNMTTRFPHAYVVNVLSADHPGIVASVSQAVERQGGNIDACDTPAETIAAILADEMAIGVVNGKTTGVRLIPAPGAKAGTKVEFGGLFGSATVMEIRCKGASSAFVRFGGRIPAPIQSLGN